MYRLAQAPAWIRFVRPRSIQTEVTMKLRAVGLPLILASTLALPAIAQQPQRRSAPPATQPSAPPATTTTQPATPSTEPEPSPRSRQMESEQQQPSRQSTERTTTP